MRSSFSRSALRSSCDSPGGRGRRARRSVLNLLMRRTVSVLFAVVLAMLVRPLQLPAASCILSNAVSPQGCKPKCCANKSCCAVSKKHSQPVSPPLYKSGDVNQPQAIAFVSVPLIDSIAVAASPRQVRVNLSVRTYSPPPLAATCIRLI